MDDLRRYVYKGYAKAGCSICGLITEAVWAETASARARKHAREEGHVTQVEYPVTVEYTPETSP